MIKRKGELDGLGWPWYPQKLEIKEGQTVTFIGRSDVQCTSSVFPLNYDRFHEMCLVGDIVYVGR